MKLFFIFLLLNSVLWSAANNKIYIPIRTGNNLSDDQQTNNSLYIQQITAQRANHIRMGNQQDIKAFNDEANWSTQSGPKPFNNRTNSYWLNPNFQFGPGSVNDFGSNPNAEQMLGPYIF